MPTTRGSRRDFAALEARRFEAAQLFGRGLSQNAVARKLGVSVTAAHRWFHAWRARGRRGLKGAGRAGRKPRLDRAALARVERALLQGAPAHGFATDLWTLPRVATVIARLTGERFHPGHVWYLLRALNWSVQRPARQSRERNEAAVTAWKSTGWRRVKKTPAAGAPGSSSKTKAASPTSR
jgi:transposase